MKNLKVLVYQKIQINFSFVLFVANAKRPHLHSTRKTSLTEIKVVIHSRYCAFDTYLDCLSNSSFPWITFFRDFFPIRSNGNNKGVITLMHSFQLLFEIFTMSSFDGLKPSIFFKLMWYYWPAAQMIKAQQNRVSEANFIYLNIKIL